MAAKEDKQTKIDQKSNCNNIIGRSSCSRGSGCCCCGRSSCCCGGGSSSGGCSCSSSGRGGCPFVTQKVDMRKATKFSFIMSYMVVVVVVVVEAVVVVVAVVVVALLNLKCLNQGDAQQKARG